MTEADESPRRSERGLDRLLALSDGIFAFAVTLLVLDLVVPVLSPGATSADLWQALSKEYGSFFSYLLSFLITGLWWMAHNRNFVYIKRSDYNLGWLNLLFLLWIAVLPFFTKLLNSYGNLQVAVVLYAADQAAAGIFMTLSWWYASRNHRLVDKGLKRSVIRSRLLNNVVAPIFFFVSMGLSFIGPAVATFFWLVMFPILFAMHRLETKMEND